jgi:hypothetical protein
MTAFPVGFSALKPLWPWAGGGLACVLLTSVAGCGPSGPPLQPVSGTLTIDGKPATNVQISFMPTDPSRPVASGNCDAAGRYELTSGAADRKGAVAGAYKVVLSQLESLSAEEEAARYASGSGGPPRPPKPPFPSEYRDASTTPKQVDVAVGPNTIDIAIP